MQQAHIYLDFNSLNLNNPTSQELYSKLAKYIAHQKQTSSNIVIGISGAPGSGKSTLCELLKNILENQFNLRTAILSLDDLYKTKAERIDMARALHPLFLTRGVPGTHDTNLGLSILSALQQGLTPIEIPKFDKLQDDRLPQKYWQTVSGKIDIILFEGWFIGAKPQTEKKLLTPINTLEFSEDPDAVWRLCANYFLKNNYAPLFKFIHTNIFIANNNFKKIYQRRLLQERRLRQQSVRQGMRSSGIKYFLAHYERIIRHMLKTETNLNHIIRA